MQCIIYWLLDTHSQMMTLKTHAHMCITCFQLKFWRSLSRGGCLYRDIIGHLKEHAFHEKKKTQQNSYIALYHAGMNSKDLNYILHEISKQECVIRIAICTIAFGMGINIPDIDIVIHWGACFSIMDYWQEVGRAGRDGREAKALYFITPGSLLHTSDDMKELCKSVEKKGSKCFRSAILSHFIGHNSTSLPVWHYNAHSAIVLCASAVICVVNGVHVEKTTNDN